MTNEASIKPKKVIPAPELPPEQCQHIRILDVNKPVQRVFYECWHCKEGLVSECTGKPIFEETAIKLITEKILSTTLIPSTWFVE